MLPIYEEYFKCLELLESICEVHYRKLLAVNPSYIYIFLVWFGFYVLWYINILWLFKAKAIFLEQWW